MRTRPGAALALIALAHVAVGQEQEHTSPSRDQFGTVSFETSCTAAAQAHFNHAVAMLHSFEFAPAIDAFNDVARTDPSCGISYWGVALASWGNPFAAGQKAPAQIRRGQDAIDQASRTGAKSERERAYIAAAAELYRDNEQRDQRTRVLAYRDAMGALASRHPEDMEASIFYALALAQSVPPTDKTYADLLKAGGILEGLFAKHPDHPGLAHYIIHSYDVPPLAARALDAARRYAQIAPSAPHALHMPSHTFTRLGYWQESIDTNIASAAAAKRVGAMSEELHATDYEMYAYLQTGQDAAARRLLESLPEIAARFDPDAVGSAAPGVAGVFAIAAIPARWALERREWGDAVKLESRPSRFEHTEAMTFFARALGACGVGDRAAAQAAVDSLEQIRTRLAAARETYWAGQVEIEWRSAGAWLALAEGRNADALAAMRGAADLEDGTEKNAITPGPIAPARELLGEMLLEVHEPAQALKEFVATLQKEPDRFRALAGAGRAAAQAGDRATATKYYSRLLKTCERADSPGRPELVEARRFAAAITPSR
jgi:tetratricopeptide (TPR) repeat protein